jgi:hypothetical protein
MGFRVEVARDELVPAVHGRLEALLGQLGGIVLVHVAHRCVLHARAVEELGLGGPGE